MKPFSSEFYSPTNQDILFQQLPGNEELRQERLLRALKARLRYNHLLSGRIVLSRGDVLDGQFFVQATPSAISGWLGLADEDPRPITILTKTGSIETDLLDWYRPPGELTLHGEPTLVVPESLPDRFATEFKKVPRTEVKKWTDIPRVFAMVLERPEVKSFLETYWGGWVSQATSCAKIAMFTGEPNFGAFLPSALSASSLSGYGIEAESSDGREALRLYGDARNELRSNRGRPGHMVRWMDKHLPESPVGVAVRDQLSIAISRAKAAANGTDHETITGADIPRLSRLGKVYEFLTDAALTDRQSPAVHVAMPEALMEWLAWLGDADYAELLRNVGPSRDRWFAVGDDEALKRFADTIGESVAKNPAPLPVKPAGLATISRLVGTAAGGYLAARWSVASGEELGGLVIIGVSTGWKIPPLMLTQLARFTLKQEVAHQIVQSVTQTTRSLPSRDTRVSLRSDQG